MCLGYAAKKGKCVVAAFQISSQICQSSYKTFFFSLAVDFRLQILTVYSLVVQFRPSHVNLPNVAAIMITINMTIDVT